MTRIISLLMAFLFVLLTCAHGQKLKTRGAESKSIQTDTLPRNMFVSANSFGPGVKFVKAEDVNSNGSTAARMMSDPGISLPAGAAEAKTPDVVMPSPNSSTLVNLVSENADLYTGKLNLSIPLYTLKSRNIELPVSLQGSGNAHQVNEIASWVGLGWSLNAGGSITRVMNNLPDEMTGALFTSAINSTHFNFRGTGYIYLKPNENVDLTMFDPGFPFAAYSTATMKDIVKKGAWNIKNDQPSKGYDLQPDHFYFNFGNYSGKFVFDQDGKINVIPKNNLTITPAFEIRDGHNRIASFVVTTEDGYKYEFGNYSLNAVEETRLKTESKSLQMNFPAYWGTDQYGNVVYPVDANGYFYHSRYPAIMSHDGPLDPTAVSSNIPDNLNNLDYSGNTESTEYFYYSSTWHLTKITSPTEDFISLNYQDNGLITYLANRSFNSSTPDQHDNFEPGPNGGNYYMSPRLPIFNNAIKTAYSPSPQIFSVSTSTIELKSKRLSSIITSQGYSLLFEANTSRQDLPGDKRLDKITVKHGLDVVKEFQFNYTNQYDNSALESFKFTYFRPRYNYSGGNFTVTDYVYGSESGRTFPVPEYCRYRMFLTSVQEKGRSNENIPPYQFGYYNSTQLPFRTSTEQDNFGFANSNPNRHPFSYPTYQYQYPYWSTSITGVSPYFGLDVSTLFFQTMNGGNNQTWPPRLHYGNHSYDINKLHAGVIKKITYPTGGYKEFVFEFSGNTNAWNGLRIKEIKEYESASAAPVIKNYSYGTFNQTDGAAMTYKMPEFLDPNYVFATHRIFFSSSRANPENQTRGSAGGYDYAEVNQLNNGKYRIEFTNSSQTGFPDVVTPTKIVSSLINPEIQDFSLKGYYYPFPPASSGDWKRGMPSAEYFYKADNKLVKSVLYGYDYATSFAADKSVYGLQVSKYGVTAYTNQGQISWDWRLYGRHNHVSKWVTPSSKETREYAPDGINFLVNREEYVYRKSDFNSREFVFLDQTKLVNNGRNDQVIQKFKYPLDYTSTTDTWGLGIANLKTKNVLNVPVEKYQFLQDLAGNNKRYVGGQLSKYAPDKPLISQTYSFQPSSVPASFVESNISGAGFVYDPNYKSSLNFGKYDTYGNTLEQNKDLDIKESYIWDYSATLPVAKVLNASNAEIAYTSFESDGKGNWGYHQSPGVITFQGGITGKKCFDISQGMWLNSTVQNPTISASKKYIIALWAKGATPGINVNHPGGGSDIVLYDWYTPKFTVGDWKYYEVLIENATDVGIWKWGHTGPSFVDEVRLFPLNAQMETYTFDPLVGMTSQADANCRITYYEYDGLNRLRLTRDQNGNVTKTFEYNYKQ